MPIRSIAPPILRLPTILLVGAVAGCAGAPDAATEETEPAARTEPSAAARSSADGSSRAADDGAGLVLLLACDRAYVEAGAEIPVRVILQNRSDRPIRAACPKHNPYLSYRVIVARPDGTEVDTGYDDPYFYEHDPMVRSGFELTPVEFSDSDDEIRLLPAGLEWEGRIGTTFLSCGDEEHESYEKPMYLSLGEPGKYTIRVTYRFDRAEALEALREWGESSDFSAVPELDIASNILEVTVLPAPSSEDGDEEEEAEE